MLRSCTVGAGPWHTSRYRSIVASVAKAQKKLTVSVRLLTIIEAEDLYAYGEWIIIAGEDEEVYEVYAFFECIESSTDVK